MPNYVSTIEIVEEMSYFSSASDFFSNFHEAWRDVKNHVFKLETRQSYREPGNPSYDELEKGNFVKAVELIEESKKEDIKLYLSLKDRNVKFYRCRPISFPISDYLQWELECYKFNSLHGENIFISKTNEIYQNYALHDFMVFDDTLAFVHDYNHQGEIIGGWKSTNRNIIDNLSILFLCIKEKSESFLESKLLD